MKQDLELNSINELSFIESQSVRMNGGMTHVIIVWTCVCENWSYLIIIEHNIILESNDVREKSEAVRFNELEVIRGFYLQNGVR